MMSDQDTIIHPGLLRELQLFQKEQQRLNRSEHTILNSHSDLVQIAKFLLSTFDEHIQWSQVNRAQVQAFIKDRFESGISASTLARQLSSLRSFYRFLKQNVPDIIDPTHGVKAPKKPQHLPKSIDLEATTQLLEVPADSWMTVRDNAIFELLYSSGMRVSECVSMELSPHLDELFSGWIHVLGKGKKERLVPVGQSAMKALVAWLKIRNEHAKTEEKAVFVNRLGNRLAAAGIRYRLDARSDLVGFDSKMSPHRFRHACATHVLESSADLRAVQEMLGHANLATTQIYTKVDVQHLQKVFADSHPRAKKIQINKRLESDG
jgi:integrase/recombinase XerC